MNETMNLNGMGIGSNSVNSNNIVMPNTSNDVITDTKVEDNQVTEEKTNDDLEKLKNEFKDLDMIKELRADEEKDRHKNDSIFSSMDFGPLKKYLEDDDVTDISYSNGGQLWLKTLSKGVYRVEQNEINDALIEKIAFQCSNVMGKTFNMAHPFLDSESAELRMNFIHESIARNGIAVVFRKTPAKIRLQKEKLLKENYVSLSVHDFLIKAVQGHCNIIMCGETGSGKTEFLKYLASHTFENEKIVTIEDTLELHLDRIYPHRDIVAMKTNNIASYSDVLVTCMRQNPIWILLSEVRSAEAVTAVRNSISSGHFILSTIHADKASNIPYRLYSLLESNIDVEQFLNTIYRYIQLGVYLRGRFDPKLGRYVREIGEVTEFYVDDNNNCVSNTIYLKTISGDVTYNPISEHLLNYLEGQGIDVSDIRAANGNLEINKSIIHDDEIKDNVHSDVLPSSVPGNMPDSIKTDASVNPVGNINNIGAEQKVQVPGDLGINNTMVQPNNMGTNNPVAVNNGTMPVSQAVPIQSSQVVPNNMNGLNNMSNPSNMNNVIPNGTVTVNSNLNAVPSIQPLEDVIN